MIYDERRGGYIAQHRPLPSRAPRRTKHQLCQLSARLRWKRQSVPVPPNSVVINNASLVGEQHQSCHLSGLRVEALYQINEDWKALLAQSYQNMDAQGVFAEMAANSLGQPQPDLTVQLYNPSYDKDRFENTALTVDGRVPRGSRSSTRAPTSFATSSRFRTTRLCAQRILCGLLSVRESRARLGDGAMLFAERVLAL